MSSRIEEQNKRAIDLNVLERQRINHKQQVQRAFASELRSHAPKEKPVAADIPKTEKTEPRLLRPSGNDRTKKFERKEDPLKKEEEAPPKDSKKRSDLKINDAVKRRNDSKSDDKGSHDSDAFFSQAARFATQQTSPSAEPAKSFSTTLPAEVITALVESVYSSTSADGSQVLTIELKNGVLSGAQITVSTKGPKVNLQFSVEEADTRALLRNSKQVITQRLEEKNLSLLEFVVH